MSDNDPGEFTLLRTGDSAFDAMLAAIEEARSSVRLETYIFADCELTRTVLNALLNACDRGVKVLILLDAFGSVELADDFWKPLMQRCGIVRWFNPLSLRRLSYRNHRKLLVCDERVAFIGGFNLAPEYEGDGIVRGWCDCGLQIQGAMVGALSKSFDLLWDKADMRHDLWHPLRRRMKDSLTTGKNWTLLLNIPSFRRHLINRALTSDLTHARQVRIAAAYFLPTHRIRKRLIRLAQTGARVQLILAGRSDVRLAQLAGHHLYERLLRAGVEIYEYQPQVLHAKLVVADDAVYVGSCNLDLRSLNFNYELMARVTDPELKREANDWFDEALRHSRKIERQAWKTQRGRWSRLKERAAYFALTRLDPLIARRQLALLN
jgi:cardiolipin synthase A/B